MDGMLKWVWDFLVVTIVFKMMIAHSLVRLLNQWIIQPWFGSTPRKEAIWLHYQSKAAGLGHANEDVTSCGEDHCKLFQAA